MKSVYEITPEIIEWLNHNLFPVEESVFVHYRGIIDLVDIVDKAEAGAIVKYAALSAIREYNEENDAALTYEEIRDRSPTYIFSGAGEWAAYVDSPYATQLLVLGEHDDPDMALSHAHPDINWLVVWLPQDECVVVYRSPHRGHRALAYEEEEGVVEGLSKGPHEAYVLPPEIEASLGWGDPREILRDHYKSEVEIACSRRDYVLGQ